MDKEFAASCKVFEHASRQISSRRERGLAATAIWGSQQANLDEDLAKYDGVYGMWYGKGPASIVRATYFGMPTWRERPPMAAFWHWPATIRRKSSTVPASRNTLIDAQIPFLHPANIQEVDYGILGWAMSRYSGCWVGMKCITDNVDSSASVAVDPHRIKIVTPQILKCLTMGFTSVGPTSNGCGNAPTQIQDIRGTRVRPR